MKLEENKRTRMRSIYKLYIKNRTTKEEKSSFYEAKYQPFGYSNALHTKERRRLENVYWLSCIKETNNKHRSPASSYQRSTDQIRGAEYFSCIYSRPGYHKVKFKNEELRKQLSERDMDSTSTSSHDLAWQVRPVVSKPSWITYSDHTLAISYFSILKISQYL